ncbi:MAG: 3-isopropylmalate dehydratase small subunit [Alphaproteobacteria bacterium]|nr:3-isopropylmalate dehydratase small subunit [Alphaproteobacteria bacterium]
MEAFVRLEGVAAALPMANVDTDMIIPKQFLKTIRRTGLGQYLFHERRRTEDGAEIDSFVLNRPPWRDAEILIAGTNFGCGSSREHAPWALADFGIRCVVAPSFADIFFNNSAKNGILLITLPEADVETLMQDAGTPESARMTVDLRNSTITRANGAVLAFAVDDHRQHCLLNGLDDIGLTLERTAAIEAYEARATDSRAWLVPGTAA